jgi:hypothetical protein
VKARATSEAEPPRGAVSALKDGLFHNNNVDRNNAT